MRADRESVWWSTPYRSEGGVCWDSSPSGWDTLDSRIQIGQKTSNMHPESGSKKYSETRLSHNRLEAIFVNNPYKCISINTLRASVSFCERGYYTVDCVFVRCLEHEQGKSEWMCGSNRRLDEDELEVVADESLVLLLDIVILFGVCGLPWFFPFRVFHVNISCPF